MKIFLIVIVSLLIPMQSFAYSEYAYFLKDGFWWSSKALIYTRESRYDNYELHVVEYGMGCWLWMWRYEWKKVVINTGSSYFLDGISDTLILSRTGWYGSNYTCKIWDVDKLSDVFDNLDSNDIEYLSDNWFLE